jgi:GT2 family glycosyltransferase
MTIPVIVLNWNGLDDTIECVDALLRMEHPDFRIILVDNGSEPDQSEALIHRYGGVAGVEVRRNDSNLGFTRGVNRELQGLVDAEGIEFVALLNNDAVPTEGWLSALEHCARARGAGLVASRMLRYENDKLLDNAGHQLLITGEILPRGSGKPAAGFSKPATIVGACAGAALISRTLLREVGLFDLYFQTGYEDAELGLRALMAGYPTVYCPEAIVRHKISRSVDRIRDRAFAIKLQQDITYTWFKLAPTGLLLMSFPLVALKLALILLLAFVSQRSRLFSVQWTAFRESFLERSRLRRARHDARWLRRCTSWTLLRYQLGSVFAYIDYVRRYVIRRQATVFER